MADLEEQRHHEQTKLACHESRIVTIDQQIQKMRVDKLKRMLDKISGFELLDSHLRVLDQDIDTDWALIETEANFEDLNIELQKRLFQQYAARQYSAKSDYQPVMIYHIWDEFHSAFLEHWLKSNNLQFRQGLVALGDIT